MKIGNKNVPDYNPFDPEMVAPIDPKIRKESIGRIVANDAFDPKSKANKERLEREREGIPHGEIKLRYQLQYKPRDFEDYKNRLAIALSNNGLSCSELVKDSTYSNYVKNCAADMIRNNATKNRIMGLTLRLDNVDLASYTKDGSRLEEAYPVINEFAGHFLRKTYYFVKIEGGVKVEAIDVKKSTIDIK